MDQFNSGDQKPSRGPVPMGRLYQESMAECIRKWCAGAALTETERQVVDHALAENRLELIASVFAEREVARVDR